MLSPRRVVAIGALVVLAALVAGATATGLVSWSSLSRPAARSHLAGAPPQRASPGAGTGKGGVRPHPREDSPVGTDSWRLTRPAGDDQIAGYARQMSVLPGQP